MASMGLEGLLGSGGTGDGTGNTSVVVSVVRLPIRTDLTKTRSKMRNYQSTIAIPNINDVRLTRGDPS